MELPLWLSPRYRFHHTFRPRVDVGRIVNYLQILQKNPAMKAGRRGWDVLDSQIPARKHRTHGNSIGTRSAKRFDSDQFGAPAGFPFQNSRVPTTLNIVPSKLLVLLLSTVSPMTQSIGALRHHPDFIKGRPGRGRR